MPAEPQPGSAPEPHGATASGAAASAAGTEGAATPQPGVAFR